MSKMIPSPQQQAVYDAVETGKSSLRVEAVAGAGKTTTLIGACSRMKGSVAFMAYNKKIATEIQQRLQSEGVGQNVRAGTFHSFGFQAWRRVATGVKVDDKKVYHLIDTLQVPEAFRAFVRQAVSLAKQRAIGVLCSFSDRNAWQSLIDHFELTELLEGDTQSYTDELCLDGDVQEALNWSFKVLKASVDQDKQVIDFDDMIYAPLVHDCRMFQNDWVLIDEAQDTNPARRALAKKMLKPGGRVLAVGDSRQAIYGFTGADSDAIDLIEKEFGCERLPLTVTYRCPKSVVRHAQNWVSHIEAHPSAPKGEVRTIAQPQFEALSAGDLTKDDAILCRNTKPLVSLAYSFIRKGIPCHVEGRDIGRGLLALAKKWKTRNLEKLQDKLNAYLAKEMERLLAKGQETKAESLADKVETLFVIIDSLPGGSTVKDLETQIGKLFGDTEQGQSPNLTLSTVHKAKGREWDRVYLYGRNRYMPSKYARQQWQLDQELNLMYVAVTRAKKILIEVEVMA